MGIAVALIGIPVYVVLFFLAIFLLLRKPKLAPCQSDGRWMAAGFVVTLGLVPLVIYLLNRTFPTDEALFPILFYVYLAPFLIYLFSRVRHSVSYVGKGAMLAFMSYPICIGLIGAISMGPPSFDNGKSWRVCYVLQQKHGTNNVSIPHVDTKTKKIAWDRSVSAHSLEKGFSCSNMNESLSPMDVRVYTATEENYRNGVATAADKPTTPLHVSGELGGTVCVYMTPEESKSENDPEWKVELGRCNL